MPFYFGDGVFRRETWTKKQGGLKNKTARRAKAKSAKRSRRANR